MPICGDVKYMSSTSSCPLRAAVAMQEVVPHNVAVWEVIVPAVAVWEVFTAVMAVPGMVTRATAMQGIVVRIVAGIDVFLVTVTLQEC